MLPYAGWLVFELIGIIALVIAGLYIYFKYVLYNFWRSKGVVHREPTVPFGNFGPVVAGEMSMAEFFADEYARFKGQRYIGTYTLHKPSLLISDPDLIRYVLTKEFTHFHDRGLYCNEKGDPLTANLFAMSGTKWKNLRSKLSPTFTSGKMKQMFAIVKDCGEELGRYLEDIGKAGEVLEMKEILARFSTDVIASAAFGFKCNSLNNPDHEFRYWGRKAIEPRRFMNTFASFAPRVVEFLNIPFFGKQSSKFFIKLFEDNVSYREKNNVVRHDFMNLLIPLIRNGHIDGNEGSAAPHVSETTEGNITMLEGAAQAFIFFLAGFETSSSAVTHCLYELAINQDIQDKLRREVDSVLEKSGGLTYESLNDMPYLHKTVSETLRKYPSVPMLNRVCTKAIDLPTTNLHVPKGLDVVIPILGIHMDPEIYPNPKTFDPERFNEENIASRHPYTYLAFGDGPRICIGMRFGLMQTKIALIILLSKYRFKLGPNTPVPLKTDPGGFLLITQGGVHLRIECR